MNDAAKLASCCDDLLDLPRASLPSEYYYHNLSSCVLDAVFSIGANYRSTEMVVRRYNEHYRLRDSPGREAWPAPTEAQERIGDFLNNMDDFGRNPGGFERFAAEVLENRQRTSSRNGILKAEAAYRFGQALWRHGAYYIQDVPRLYDDEEFAREIKAIPGQGSGISLGYFFMLAGAEDLIKPDRWILRFIRETLGRDATIEEARELVVRACMELRKKYPEMTARLLDYEIWNYAKKGMG